MEFLQHNIFWAATAVVSGALYLWNLTRSDSGLSPQTVVSLINRENGVVVDVREVGDYAKSHLGGARNIPFAQFEARLGDLEKSKNAPIIVYGAGGDAARAVKLLQKHGYARAAELQGGIEAWSAAGMPVES